MLDPIQLLKEYVSYASVSTDEKYDEGMRKSREFVCNHLKTLGFEINIVETPKHPIIFAKRGNDKDSPHIMLYAHYDVQPADPLELWDSDPFKPEIRGDRLYGRGTADNKGPFIIQLCGLARVLEKYPDLPLNITFLIEGEEEIGSPSFPEFLKNYKEKLQDAEAILISDTASISRDQLVVTTSLRGLVDLEIRVTGPDRDLHSGLYGGPIMNPIQALAELCASLHTAEGLVNIPGFYDDVMPPELWEREELKKYPLDDESYRKFLGVPVLMPPKGFTALESSRFAPTLEFNGIGGGYQEKGSKTIIPSTAFAKITCRLVANQKPEKIIELVVKALKERCPKGVKLDISVKGGGEPYLVIPPNRSSLRVESEPTLEKTFKAVDDSVQEVFKNPPLYLREGGSIPIIGQIKSVTGLDSILLGLFVGEDNLHSPNESFDLKLMERGIDVYEEIFRRLAGLS